MVQIFAHKRQRKLLLYWIDWFLHVHPIPMIQLNSFKDDSTNTHTPCWSVLDFWKFKLKKSSSTNWIFSLFRTGFLLSTKTNLEIDFCRLKMQFVELDFSNLIFQKSSTDQQGERLSLINLISYWEPRLVSKIIQL